ncbi:MAG: hypothetical protein ACK5NF_03975 [Bacilli bacterium]
MKNIKKRALGLDIGIASVEWIEKFENIEKASDFFKVSEEYYNHNTTTPYHLREKGLSEPLEKTEIMLGLYNILKHRGIFYKDELDDSIEFLCKDQLKRLD